MATLRNALLLLIVLFVAAHAVSADGITVFSPKDGATVDPTADEFTFSITYDGVVGSCQVIVDGQIAKTIAYNDNIKGKALSYLVPAEDGLHNWSISCSSDTTPLTMPTRTFTAQNPQQTGVTVTASGNFRGSFMHTFSFSNSPAQQPVVVQKLAPGDYLSILFSLPPSKITKELYVKQQSTKNGVAYLWIEDQKTGAEYYLYQGKNVTINVSTSSVLLNYRGVESNKATVVAYPRTTGAIVTDNTTKPEDENATQQEEPLPTVPPVKPTVTPPNTAPAEPSQPPAQNTTPPAEPPKQGFFQSILSWLSHLFG